MTTRMFPKQHILLINAAYNNVGQLQKQALNQTVMSHAAFKSTKTKAVYYVPRIPILYGF